MGSKRERHRQHLKRRASRRRVPMVPSRPSHSDTFPWLQASGSLPTWMIAFGILGVAVALAAFVVMALLLHHWI